MPTHGEEARFLREWSRLTSEQQERFKIAVAKFVAGLISGQMPAGLRIRQLAGHPDVYEITWAPDGRATFAYGDPVRPGDPHVVWRRIGGHDIFDEP